MRSCKKKTPKHRTRRIAGSDGNGVTTGTPKSHCSTDTDLYELYREGVILTKGSKSLVQGRHTNGPSHLHSAQPTKPKRGTESQKKGADRGFERHSVDRSSGFGSGSTPILAQVG